MGKVIVISVLSLQKKCALIFVTLINEGIALNMKAGVLSPFDGGHTGGWRTQIMLPPHHSEVVTQWRNYFTQV